MAVVNLNRKDFEREIGKLDESMQNKIAMFGTPLDGFDDKTIQIEVFPNRPDILSYHGFKRAFLGFLGKKTGLIEYKIFKPEKDYKVIIDNSVKNLRPSTACAVIKGLNLDDGRITEIIDLQEKLNTTLGRKRKKVAIGIYPLEQIKFPITLKALEPDKIKFIPLESGREMSGLEILQRHSTGKEYAHLLAGKEKFPVFVDSNNQILSMPPIINSQITGKVTEKTKDIFIECSGFNFKILEKTINILSANFADMGGKIYQIELESGNQKNVTPNLNPEEMKISLDNMNKILGLNLSEKQLKSAIEKMGYNYNKGRVKIPAWRTDVLHEVDLIEDIAIAYGYENFAPEIPEISTTGEEEKAEILKRKISEILSGIGMLETSSFHLTNRDFQFGRMSAPEKDFVDIEESKTEYNILRKNLSHYLLKILSENSDSEYPQKIFETGKVFETNGKITERENLAAAICPGNFTDVKQTTEHLGKMLNLDFEIKEADKIAGHFIEGRVGRIVFEGKEIGLIGEVHPRILRNWKIKMPVALFEISLEEIFKKLSQS